MISCQEKIDMDKEKKAIIDLIEEETASYYANDFERWSATYVPDSATTIMGASKNGFNFYPGWKSISSNTKQSVIAPKELLKEIKTPIKIKIYGESAWVIFNNESFNNNDEPIGKSLVTNFLIKENGKWKIIYRNRIMASSYYQADNFIINSINYAKSLGKNVEDIAAFTGDQFKTGWNKEAGYDGFVNSTINNWRNMTPKDKFKILEQDESHVVFSAGSICPALNSSGSQYNVTYDEYLTFLNIVMEKIADYMGSVYKQETTREGVEVTISKI
jgi:hypothetical protein